MDGSNSLFRRKLPTGLTMLDVASRIQTPEAVLVREAFAVEALARPSGGEAKDEPEASGVEGEPDEAWAPPCPGFMFCALCKGKSGASGRFGAGKDLADANLRYPLTICKACIGRYRLALDGAPSRVHVDETLRLEARGDSWNEQSGQLVHPIFGVIGQP